MEMLGLCYTVVIPLITNRVNDTVQYDKSFKSMTTTAIITKEKMDHLNKVLHYDQKAILPTLYVLKLRPESRVGIIPRKVN